jgi:hypothetical protein
MGLDIPSISLNSWAHCRWNSFGVMILELESMSLALSMKDIVGCYEQSCPFELRSDIFDFLGADLATTLSTKTALFISTLFLYSP